MIRWRSAIADSRETVAAAVAAVVAAAAVVVAVAAAAVVVVVVAVVVVVVVGGCGATRRLELAAFVEEGRRRSAMQRRRSDSTLMNFRRPRARPARALAAARVFAQSPPDRWPKVAPLRRADLWLAADRMRKACGAAGRC